MWRCLGCCCLLLAVGGNVQVLPYRLRAAGRGCSNAHKSLSLSGGSVQTCANLACADPECGNLFVISSQNDIIGCSCLSPSEACAEVATPGASWYEITDTSSCESSGGDCFATLFENGDFTGWSGSFTAGAFPGEVLGQHGVEDDGTSAIFVSGTGCVATVFQHANFTGWSATFPEGSYAAEEFVAAGAVEDEVSAVIVRHGNSPWVEDVLKPASAASDVAEQGDAVADKSPPPVPPAPPVLPPAPRPPPLGRPAPTLPPTPPAPLSGAAPPAPPPPPPRERTQATAAAAGPTARPSTPLAAKAAQPPAPRPKSRAVAPWEPLKCDVISKRNCTSDELGYIKINEKHSRTKLEEEALRLKGKHDLVKPEFRPWIRTRVQILWRLMQLAKFKTEL